MSSFMRGSRKRPPAGSSPGTMMHDPRAEETRVSFISYSPDMIDERRGCGVEAALAAREPGRVIWIDVSGLRDHAVIEKIGRAFGLHRLALEDIVNVNQRPKAERFGDHAYLVFRMAEVDRPEEPDQLSLFHGENYVLTFQERAGDCFEPVRRRIREARGHIRGAGATYLAYALIDAVVDGYFPAIEDTGNRLAELEDEILVRPEPEHIARLHRLRRRLLVFRRMMWPSRDLLNEIMRGDVMPVTPEIMPFLRDALDHAVQVIDLVESQREVAAGLIDVYLSAQNARMNEIIKLLTIISTIFIPLSFLAGLWGMNFDRSQPLNMPELGWAWGYPFALGTMALTAFAILGYIWRQGWFRSTADVHGVHSGAGASRAGKKAPERETPSPTLPA